MGDAEAFGSGQFGGADIKIAEDLNGVAVEDFALEAAGDVEGESALPGSGGPGDGDQTRIEQIVWKR